MGGLGPGYEQCIHIMAFEMLRWGIDQDIPDAGDETWREWFAECEKDPAVADCIREIGPTGAQVGAAKNLCSVYLVQGYRKGVRKVPSERHIQVSRTLPEAPPVPQETAP
jgi:hypothetical protein